MDNRRVSLLLAAGLLGAPLTADAFPGQKFVQNRIAIIRANRAQALKTKQEAALIALNPTLKAVRDAKRLEYKANNPVWTYTLPMTLASGALLTAATQSGVRGFVASALVVGAEITALATVSRSRAANAYAHGETIKYAEEHGVEFVPAGLELGQIAKK
jgi:hypothetical protein